MCWLIEKFREKSFHNPVMKIARAALIYYLWQDSIEPQLLDCRKSNMMLGLDALNFKLLSPLLPFFPFVGTGTFLFMPSSMSLFLFMKGMPC